MIYVYKNDYKEISSILYIFNERRLLRRSQQWDFFLRLQHVYIYDARHITFIGEYNGLCLILIEIFYLNYSQ